MRRFTIDVNVVLAWMELQSPELFGPANKLFRKVRRGEVEVCAPEFLLVELTNVLKWRYKNDKEETEELIKRTKRAGIRFVTVDSGEMEEESRLMYEHGLTAYDALYLLVAQETDCKLVTADPKLLEVKEWCVGWEKLDL